MAACHANIFGIFICLFVGARQNMFRRLLIGLVQEDKEYLSRFVREKVASNICAKVENLNKE